MCKMTVKTILLLIMTLAALSVLTLSASAVNDVAIDKTNFPDPVFRNWVSANVDKDNSGTLSEAELAAQTMIFTTSGDDITSLKGIEHFTSLTYLSCTLNRPTVLDLSANTKLASLYCDSSQLTSLILPETETLTLINCSYNGLTSLDLSAYTKLTEINCSNNQLTSLILPETETLTAIYCNSNKLTSLDLSGCTELRRLECYNNQLTMLDLSKNTELLYLYAYDNPFTWLDLSANTNLTTIYCDYSDYADSNAYPITLDAHGCFDLSTLPEGFDLSKTSNWSGGTVDTETEILTVDYNSDYITYNYAVAEGKTAAFRLGATSSGDYRVTLPKSETFVAVPVDGMSHYVPNGGSFSFTLVPAEGYRIGDAPKVTCTNLYSYYGPYTLTPVDGIYTLSNITRNCSISVSEAEAFGPAWVEINETNFPDAAFRDFVRQYDTDGDGYISPNKIASITEMDVYERGIVSLQGIEFFYNLTSLDCDWNMIRVLDLSQNTALTRLNSSCNPLLGLDLSQNVNLVSLDCNTNDLTALDLSANTALEYLNCTYNSLVELDLSNQPNLTQLFCGENDLVALDLSHNPKLTHLACPYNALTSLDLSNNPKISNFSCNGSYYNSIAQTLAITLENGRFDLDELPGFDYTQATSFKNCTVDPDTHVMMVNGGATSVSYVYDVNHPTYNYSMNVSLTFDCPGYQIGAPVGVNYDIVPVDGSPDYVPAGGTIRFTIVPKEGYMFADNLAVSATSWDSLTPVDGVYTIFNVTQNEVVTVSSVVSADPSMWIELSEEIFPDENFRNYLKSLDTNGDNLLTREITILDVRSMQIKSLIGIEQFTNLTRLDCSRNQLTQLDVSKNVRLTTLECALNNLTSLDLSKNTELSYLDSYYTPSQTYSITLTDGVFDLDELPAGFDFSKTTNWVNCTVDPDTHVMTPNVGVTSVSYDYSFGRWKFTVWLKLNIFTVTIPTGEGYVVRPLEGMSTTVNAGDDFSFTVELLEGYLFSNSFSVYCQSASYWQPLTPVDGVYTIENIQESITIQISGVIARDLDKWVELTAENFPDANFLAALVELDSNYDGWLERDLWQLNVSGRNIASLKGIEFFGVLNTLDCSKNELTSLDLSANTKLQSLSCEYNSLTALDVSNLTKLSRLECYRNSLTNLNLSGCTALQSLDCQENFLTVLDISQCPNLSMLCIRYNYLTFINGDNCPSLSIVNYGIGGTATPRYPEIVPVEGIFDLALLPEGFDAGRISITSGGTVDVEANTLTVSGGATQVQYSYKVNKYTNTTFTVMLSERNGVFLHKPDNAHYDIQLAVRMTYIPYGGVARFLIQPHEGYRASDMLQVAITPYSGGSRGTYIPGIPFYPGIGGLTGGIVKPQNGVYVTPQMYSDYMLNVTGIEPYNEDWVAIDTAFPDPTFRAYIKNAFDLDGDGLLSPLTLQSVKMINVAELGIKSLIGIEHFPNLQTLNCGWNALTELDVTQNTALTSLACNNNDLTALNVTQNTALILLDCEKNYITALDVTQNTALTTLRCAYNRLSTLVVRPLTALTHLDCGENDLTALDVTQNTALTSLHCNMNAIETLNLTANTKLESLYCQKNQLAALDLSACTSLNTLVANDNGLNSLKLESCRSLSQLQCQNNQLTELVLTNCRDILDLNCSANALVLLTLPNNGALTTLNCTDNKLTTLDVSLCKDLLNLNCDDNALTTLNLAANAKLVTLSCANNQLAALALEDNRELNNVEAEGNAITVSAAAGETFDLATLPGVEIDRVTELQNATIVDGSTIAIAENVTEVVYTYACSAQYSVSFTLSLAPDGLGDINNDGSVDGADLALLIAHLQGISLLNDEQIERADMDKNDVLNARDANALIRRIASN